MLIVLAASGKHFAPWRSSIPELKKQNIQSGNQPKLRIVPVREALFRKRKSRNIGPGLFFMPISSLRKGSTSSSFSLPAFSPFSWRPSFSVLISWPFSSARLFSSPPSWPVSSRPAWAQSLAQVPRPQALRPLSPAPLLRPRRSLPFRPPAPRRLPAALQVGPLGRCSGRSYLKCRPALEPLLP